MNKYTCVLAFSFWLLSSANGLPNAKASGDMATADKIVSTTWVASDKPYKAAEILLQQEHEAGQSPQSLAQKYKALAQQRPSDPVAQFTWVCAARGEAVFGGADGSVPYTLVQTLAKSDPGNVHEYTRYRFCLTDEADKILPVENAKQIGEKLLRYDPQDHWVKNSLINMLCSAGQPGAALPYARAWTNQEPGNPKAHSALGQVYFDLWEASGRKSMTYGNTSIAEYQTYLRLAPRDDTFRPYASKFISHIQRANHS